MDFYHHRIHNMPDVSGNIFKARILKSHADVYSDYFLGNRIYGTWNLSVYSIMTDMVSVVNAPKYPIAFPSRLLVGLAGAVELLSLLDSVYKYV